jgi:hypothetical protein
VIRLSQRADWPPWTSVSFHCEILLWKSGDNHDNVLEKENAMKCFQTIASLLVLSSAFAVGCSEQSKSTDKKVITDPGGKTTVTTEQTIDKTGDHKTNK